MTAAVEPAGSPLAPVHSPARGPSPGLVLLLVMGALVGAIALAVATAPPPAPQPSGVAVVSPSPAASTSPRASAPIAPPPTLPATSATTVIVLRDVADPGKALGVLARCTPLLRFSSGGLPAISGAVVDATAEAAGRETGWIFVPPGIQAVTRVWLGSDVVELARAAGWPVVALGTKRDVWLGGPAGAERWQAIPTPAGRAAWVLAPDEVTSHGRCGPWTLPASLGAQRSVTCVGVDAATCVRLVGRVEADTPGVAYPGGDMALAAMPCGARSGGCAGGPVTAVAVPAGWTGTIGGVRGATAEAPNRAFGLLAAGAAPDYALEAISRASLPLPTATGQPRPGACAATLSGDLQAAAWDPRVFWVGMTAVIWPAGTIARFGSPPALTVPRSDGSYRFVESAPVRLRGSPDPRRHAFVACSAQPLSVPSPVAVLTGP